MTILICNCCGDVLDASPDISNVENLHQARASTCSVTPGLCIDCSHEYEIGSLIVSRESGDDMVYTVLRIIPYNQFPPLLEVVSSDNHVRYFAVSRIRPHAKSDDSLPLKMASEPGYF